MVLKAGCTVAVPPEYRFRRAARTRGVALRAIGDRHARSNAPPRIRSGRARPRSAAGRRGPPVVSTNAAARARAWGRQSSLRPARAWPSQARPSVNQGTYQARGAATAAESYGELRLIRSEPRRRTSGVAVLATRHTTEESESADVPSPVACRLLRLLLDQQPLRAAIGHDLGGV